MRKIIIYLATIVLTATMWSCTEDDLNSESIFKDPDPATKTEFDKWLLENYANPYNIAFKYKMEDIETNMTYDLVPASLNNSIAIAKLIKHLWIEVYDDVAGAAFTKTYIPRIIHLIGSGAYNSNNTVLLGTAEGGLKITLYRINDIDPANVTIDMLSDRYLKTMYHEFAHILHQTRDYPADFKTISNADYIGSEWNSVGVAATLDTAYKLGFVSRYARAEANEDFVETLSIYVVRGAANWNSILTQAKAAGAAKITQKLEIVTEYLKNTWGIDINELRRVFELRASTINQLDLLNL
ncbi:MAG: putative zinc-binding metallopeptidase [Prevotellaceae bacterium]|jgi:substrate import-associated zinc metallohydrolase lipoprotein|nr:putative zinc-binding metallopeptidase [Prevotellaceae bacterium]